MSQDDAFEKQVAFMQDLFQKWLVNLQRDAFAKGTIIPPEVIAEAFGNMRDYYDELWDNSDNDIDGTIDKLLGE